VQQSRDAVSWELGVEVSAGGKVMTASGNLPLIK
jgi:hypothetical protein